MKHCKRIGGEPLTCDDLRSQAEHSGLFTLAKAHPLQAPRRPARTARRPEPIRPDRRARPGWTLPPGHGRTQVIPRGSDTSTETSLATPKTSPFRRIAADRQSRRAWGASKRPALFNFVRVRSATFYAGAETIHDIVHSHQRSRSFSRSLIRTTNLLTNSG